MKLGLTHENIHCYDCGKTIYWKEKSDLKSCPECRKSRYVEGSGRHGPHLSAQVFFPHQKTAQNVQVLSVIETHEMA